MPIAPLKFLFALPCEGRTGRWCPDGHGTRATLQGRSVAGAWSVVRVAAVRFLRRRSSRPGGNRRPTNGSGGGRSEDVERALAAADEIARGGDSLAALDELTRANRKLRDEAIERRLVMLRREAF